MPDITNDAQLVQIMESAATEAMEAIADIVLEKFKNDYLMRYVYLDHEPNVMYQDSFEFRDAWNWTPIRKETMTLAKEMWYNPGMLLFDMDSFKHGSLYSTPPDARAGLMDILNKEGRSSSLWLSSTSEGRTHAYWTEFIDSFVESGDMERIVTAEFEKRGFTRI